MGRVFLLMGLALGLAAVLLLRGIEQDVDAGTAVRLESIADLVDEARLVFEGHIRTVDTLAGPESARAESSKAVTASRKSVIHAGSPAGCMMADPPHTPPP